MSEPQRIGDIANLADYQPPPATATPRRPATPPAVPTKYTTPLDELDQDDAVTLARTWLQQRPSAGLILAGPVGRGKSSIAGAIAIACDAPRRASFWPVADLLDAIKAEFGQDLDRKSTRTKLDERPMLILDDIGTERATDWQLSQLSEIIDHRYRQQLGLVVTTNLTPRQLEERLGERTASRLHEMCELVPVTGPDRRRQHG